MLLISGIVVIIIAIVLFIISVYGRKAYLSKKERCTSEAEGTLVGFEAKETLDDRHVHNEVFFYPVYEYFVDGNRYLIQSSYGGKINDESLIGRKRKILYNPNDCAESLVSGENLKNAFKIVKIFGVVFLLLGVLEIAAYIFI